jgi:hypothetical protein
LSTVTPAARIWSFERGPDFLLAGGQCVGLAADGGSCCEGVRPSAERSSTSSSCWPFRPGDPHHEEFVEIVAGDGQEAQPLEQGMRLVARFLQHPRLKASHDNSRLK